MFGYNWIEASVLGSQLFEQASMDGCAIVSLTLLSAQWLSQVSSDSNYCYSNIVLLSILSVTCLTISPPPSLSTLPDYYKLMPTPLAPGFVLFYIVQSSMYATYSTVP